MIIDLKFQNYLCNSRLLFCLRVFIALLGSVGVTWCCLHNAGITVLITLGVIAAACTDFDDGATGQLLNMALILPSFAITSIVVTLLLPYPLFFLLAIITFAFCLTFLGIFGERFVAIAYGSLLIAVYTVLVTSSHSIWYYNPLFLVMGVFWFNLLSFIIHLFFPTHSIRNSLTECYYALGDYLDHRTALFDPNTLENNPQSLTLLIQANQRVVTALSDAHTAISRHLKGKYGRKTSQQILVYYFTLWDIHERANSTQINYLRLSKILEHSDILFRFQHVLSQLARSSRAIAISIKQNTPYQYDQILDITINQLAKALQNFSQNNHTEHALYNALQNSFANITATNEQFKALTTTPSLALKLSTQSQRPHLFQKIRQNLTPDSILFRHAIRISVVLGCCDIVVQLCHVFIQRSTLSPHAYWIMLTGLLVCKPNYIISKKRLIYRIIGTLIGILAVQPLTYYLFPSVAGKLFLLVVFALLFFAFPNNLYAYASACITIFVLTSISLLGEPEFPATMVRAIATIIGAGIAWLCLYYIWPDWKFRQLSQTLKNASLANSEYLKTITLSSETTDTILYRYHFSRQQAYLRNTELTQKIEEFKRQPHQNSELIKQSQLLAQLNHKILGYISTLGAQRHLLSQEPQLALLNTQLDKLSCYLTLDNTTTTLIDPITIKIELQQIFEHNPAIKTSQNYILWQQVMILATDIQKWMQGYLTATATIE